MALDAVAPAVALSSPVSPGAPLRQQSLVAGTPPDLSPTGPTAHRRRWSEELDDSMTEAQMETQQEQQHSDPQVVEERKDLRGDAAGMRTNVTTLMIRNVPADVTQEELFEELNHSGFKGAFDFCYLPLLSFETGCGKGFAFVNFVTEADATSFISAWHGSRRFRAAKTDPTLNISAAALQGREANLAKWSKKRASRIRDPKYRPFVRDE